MPSTRASYQEGSISQVPRAKGPDQWVYRWRETAADGRKVRRNKIIGDVLAYPNKASAKKAVETFRSAVNSSDPIAQIGYLTVREAWDHFQLHELKNSERSPTTIQGNHDYFNGYILPRWGETQLDQVKAVAVEGWLRGLLSQPLKLKRLASGPTNTANLQIDPPEIRARKPLMPGSKAKIRSNMHTLYEHVIRYELNDKSNPISSVRQSAQRGGTPDILTLQEIGAILANVESPPIRVMVATAATSAFRRSEFRGLKWEDVISSASGIAASVDWSEKYTFVNGPYWTFVPFANIHLDPDGCRRGRRGSDPRPLPGQSTNVYANYLQRRGERLSSPKWHRRLYLRIGLWIAMQSKDKANRRQCRSKPPHALLPIRRHYSRTRNAHPAIFFLIFQFCEPRFSPRNAHLPRVSAPTKTLKALSG